MIYKYLIRPFLFQMDPEEAHEKVMQLLSQGRVVARIFESYYAVNDPKLLVETMGLRFRNPVGLAAGLDKNAVAFAVWEKIGLGFIEIGTVTPRPQEGNPRPRVFRLVENQALINRLGFNGIGVDAVYENIKQASGSSIPKGINVGKNRNTPNEQAAADYLEVMEKLMDFADYFVINVSSPNTLGLRDLQHPSKVASIVKAAVNLVSSYSNQSAGRPVPVLVKVAPDFDGEDLEDTIDAALEAGVSGIIATNTTLSRRGLKPSRFINETGGMSGVPLCKLADHVVKRIFRRTQGRIPIIGVGGIFSAEDAFKRICCGASLIQVCTGLVYEGPSLVRRINKGLIVLLQRNRLASISEAVGRDCS